MNDYILWIMRDNTHYVLLQFLNDVNESRIQQVQKEFTLNGYMVRECRCDNGKTTMEFYKADGARDYIVQTRDECVSCEEIKK